MGDQLRLFQRGQYRDNPAHGLRDQCRWGLDLRNDPCSQVIESLDVRIRRCGSKSRPADMDFFGGVGEPLCDRQPELRIAGGAGKEEQLGWHREGLKVGGREFTVARRMASNNR